MENVFFHVSFDGMCYLTRRLGNQIMILQPVERNNFPKNNPPKFSVEFFNNQRNLENITCYSNEGDQWEKSNITISKNKLSIKFREPFVPRRGRINCSLNDNGKWRWFGTQFTVKLN